MIENYTNIKAPIFNIQTYSIHDGPGIRVTVFVKGCPLRCLWCANPESILPRPQLMTYASKCIGCGKCLEVCPNKAITLRMKNKKIVEITDRNMCTNCGTCVNPCPNDARKISGEEMSVDNILEQVLKDKLFIDASGGGMTLSGGECLINPDFSEALLCAAKNAGLHTAVETCLYAKRDAIRRVFRYADLGLLDIKHMDPHMHKKLTGVSNEIILDNIIYVYHELRTPVIVRAPIVPGYNDSEGNISAMAKFVSEELSSDVCIHLLPYHMMGESKNESLGKSANMSIEAPTGEHMQELLELVNSFGISAQIGG